MIKLLFLCIASAGAVRPAEWSKAVEVRHDENLCVSYQARLDGPYLVVRANIVQGWLDDARSTAIEKSVAGVAYCATLHTIANSNNYTAYEQAILGDNLHKHFFIKFFCKNIMVTPDEPDT